MLLPLEKCNPFIRAALVAPAILEAEGARKAYDHRLFYVLAGSGKIVIENKDYNLSQGSLICIPPAVKYYFRGKMKVIIINYDVTRSLDDKKTPGVPPPEDQFDENLIFDRTLAEGFDKPIVWHNLQYFASDIVEITGSFNRRDASSDALCSAKLKAILAGITPGQDNPETLLTAKIKGHITMYATEIKSIEELAKHFGYHPVYLEAVFKKETGQTMHTAIVDERIKIACRWLLNTNYTMDIIAENTGFSSRTHFCTTFKTKTGLTPSRWKKEHTK